MRINTKLLTPHKEVMTEALKDPEFRAIWKKNAPRREITKAIIGERIRRKMTQKELAEKAGLKQPNVARLENGGRASIDTLIKVAQAFDKQLKVSFEKPERTYA